MSCSAEADRVAESLKKVAGVAGFSNARDWVEVEVRTHVMKTPRLKKRFLALAANMPETEALTHMFYRPGLVHQYFDTTVFTERRLERAMLLQHGSQYPDGWAGIKMKKEPYQSMWQVEVVDGENGTVFFKRYDHFPTREELAEDALFDLAHRPPKNKN